MKAFPHLLVLVLAEVLPGSFESMAEDLTQRAEDKPLPWLWWTPSGTNAATRVLTNSPKNRLQAFDDSNPLRGLTNSMGVIPRKDSVLAPGVYKTEPYTMIVVSPAGHPDDRALKPAAPPEGALRQVTPELRVKPWQPGK